MNMHLTMISPRLAIQKGDFLGSGVPYWPIELATLAAFAREQGDAVSLVDLFGSDPTKLSDAGDHYLQGCPIEEFMDGDAFQQADAFLLFAISHMSHRELLAIISKLKKQFPHIPTGILENSQAVTAYSLQRLAGEFLDAGADLLICGEPYFNWQEIKSQLAEPRRSPVPENIITRESGHCPKRIIQKKMRYPIPAWDLINLRNYWSLPYSHGPKTRKFLPVLTSRGCPYPCDFCVVPETNDTRWRGNEPEHVVDEMIALRNRFGVRDFQVEDLNPTVNRHRWEKICELLIERKAHIRFYFVSGTKSETLHVDKVPLLAKAGCRYISISPESGSRDLMKIIGKYFNHEHGIELIRACREHGIRTQACFLVGHPDEREADFKASKDYLTRLVQAGLDEVAIFIVAPFAGSALHEKGGIGLDDPEALMSFSPKGRWDYKILERRRNTLIRVFFMQKLKRGWDLWLQGLRALVGIPETKMENLPRRMAFVGLWIFLSLVKQKLSRKT